MKRDNELSLKPPMPPVPAAPGVIRGEFKINELILRTGRHEMQKYMDNRISYILFPTVFIIQSIDC